MEYDDELVGLGFGSSIVDSFGLILTNAVVRDGGDSTPNRFIVADAMVKTNY